MWQIPRSANNFSIRYASWCTYCLVQCLHKVLCCAHIVRGGGPGRLCRRLWRPKPCVHYIYSLQDQGAPESPAKMLTSEVPKRVSGRNIGLDNEDRESQLPEQLLTGNWIGCQRRGRRRRGRVKTAPSGGDAREITNKLGACYCNLA